MAKRRKRARCGGKGVVKSGPRKGCCKKHRTRRKHSGGRRKRSVWTSPTYSGC